MRIYFTMLLLVCGNGIFAQSALLQTHMAIFFDDQTDKDDRIEILKRNGLIDQSDISEFRYKPLVLIPFEEEIVSRLVREPNVKYVSPVHATRDGKFVTYCSNFFVRISGPANFQQLLDISKRIGVEVVGSLRYSNDIIELRTAKEGIDAISAVNEYKRSGYFRNVSPNLIHSVTDCSVNDPRFNRQWNLKNDGSGLQGNGVIGADINAEAAWAITTGSTDVNIAIVDSGVDTLHPELLGKLLPGFDAMGDNTNGYPTPNFDNDGHGTSCAGIAAANTNNEIGVAGVCPDCNVIPIRVFHYEVLLGEVQPWSETQFFLDCMGWQAQADIDVSSNSWAVPDLLLALYPGSDTLVNALIDEVVENGRGGLGTPMLFSSGNDGITDTIPLWPARYEKTIAVGATSMCDEQKTPTSCDGENWWAGNWGEGLDVSAPGVKVATIDMLGSNGFNNTEYYNSFNGTSAACPNAAGVMALILSHTPSLPEWLARKVLATTSEKVGGYDYSTWKEHGGWSLELGYGRIDAFDAVTYGASAISESTDQHLVLETHAEHFTIGVKTDKQTVDWLLFDAQGKLVDNGVSTNTLLIQKSNLTSGLHILKLEIGSEMKTLKLMVP